MVPTQDCSITLNHSAAPHLFRVAQLVNPKFLSSLIISLILWKIFEILRSSNPSILEVRVLSESM